MVCEERGPEGVVEEAFVDDDDVTTCLKLGGMG